MNTENTKSIRISAATYRDLEKLGTLSDSFDSVIRELLRSREKRGAFTRNENPS
jgi:predicted CopG family antitoxin